MSCSALASNPSRKRSMATLIRNRRIATRNPLSPDEKEGEVLRLEPHDDPAAAAGRLAHVTRVEVNFPKFGDGRGYSIARLLRERYGYQGELRAVGEVLADQLQYMLRCGFDSFALAEGKDVAAAIRAMQDFTITYQAATDDPRPLYRRVARGEKSV